VPPSALQGRCALAAFRAYRPQVPHSVPPPLLRLLLMAATMSCLALLSVALRSSPDQSIRCPSLCGPAGHSLAWHLLKFIEWIKVGSKMPLTARRSPSRVPFSWQAVCGTRWRPAKGSVPNGHYQLRNETRKSFEQPSARNQPMNPQST